MSSLDAHVNYTKLELLCPSSCVCDICCFIICVFVKIIIINCFNFALCVQTLLNHYVYKTNRSANINM